MLDTDELLAALSPPSVRISGQEYIGRYPSFLERLEIDKKWNATDWTDGEQQRALVEYICQMVGVPSEPVLALPEEVMTQVATYFWMAARGLSGETKVEVTEENPPSSEPSESSA